MQADSGFCFNQNLATFARLLDTALLSIQRVKILGGPRLEENGRLRQVATRRNREIHKLGRLYEASLYSLGGFCLRERG